MGIKVAAKHHLAPGSVELGDVVEQGVIGGVSGGWVPWDVDIAQHQAGGASTELQPDDVGGKLTDSEAEMTLKMVTDINGQAVARLGMLPTAAEHVLKMVVAEGAMEGIC